MKSNFVFVNLNQYESGCSWGYKYSIFWPSRFCFSSAAFNMVTVWPPWSWVHDKLVYMLFLHFYLNVFCNFTLSRSIFCIETRSSLHKLRRQINIILRNNRINWKNIWGFWIPRVRRLNLCANRITRKGKCQKPKPNVLPLSRGPR